MIFSVCSLLTGICFTVFALFFLWKAWSTEEWEDVPGKVVGSSIRESANWDSEVGTSLWYRPSILYEYKDQDVVRISTKVGILRGGFISSSQVVQNVVDRYKPGTAVTVYKNPANPRETVLEPGSNWVIYVLLTFGVLWLLIGVISIMRLVSFP